MARATGSGSSLNAWKTRARTCSGVMRLNARVSASTSSRPIGRSTSIAPSFKKIGSPVSAASGRFSGGAANGLCLERRNAERTGGDTSKFMPTSCRTQLEQTIQSRAQVVPCSGYCVDRPVESRCVENACRRSITSSISIRSMTPGYSSLAPQASFSAALRRYLRAAASYRSTHHCRSE